MMQEAYRDGYKAGRADYLIGKRSDYAWWGVNEPIDTYTYWYSKGYQVGWAKGWA